MTVPTISSFFDTYVVYLFNGKGRRVCQGRQGEAGGYLRAFGT